MSIREKIGRRIVYYRKKKQLTQEELVERVGEDKVSLSTLKRIEGGNGHFDMLRLNYICKALGCSLSDLVQEDDKRAAIEEFYDGELDDDTIEDMLIRQLLLYPEIPDKIIYRRRSIMNLMQLVIYLPLMDPELLMTCLKNIEGCAFDEDSYVLDKLDVLYRNIPEGPAKEYADLMASKCTAKHFMEYHSTELSEIDADWLDQSTWPRLQALRDAYVAVIDSKLKIIKAVKEINT